MTYELTYGTGIANTSFLRLGYTSPMAHPFGGLFIFGICQNWIDFAELITEYINRGIDKDEK